MPLKEEVFLPSYVNAHRTLHQFPLLPLAHHPPSFLGLDLRGLASFALPGINGEGSRGALLCAIEA